MPYRFGGGHQNWQDTGYDCSGSVSYALHGAGLLDTPLASYDFYNWGEAGPGQWVTIYAKDDHAYMVVAGLRYDTSASKGGGSRWTTAGARARRLRRAPPRRPLASAGPGQRPGPTASVSARSSAKRSRSTPSPRVSRSTDAMRTIAAESCSRVQRADWRASLRATNSLRRPELARDVLRPAALLADVLGDGQLAQVARDRRHPARHVAVGAVEQPAEHAQRVGRPPVAERVGEIPGRRVGGEHAELVDALGGDRLAARPQPELLDLARERLRVVAGQLEQARERAAVEIGAGARGLLAQPLALALLARAGRRRARCPPSSIERAQAARRAPRPAVSSASTASGAGAGR